MWSPDDRYPLIRPPYEKTVAYPLLTNQIVPTGGNATPVYTELDAAPLLRLGKDLEAIVPYSTTFARSTNHAWNIVFQWSFDGKNWYSATPIDLFTVITANGPLNHPAYSTTTNFGLYMRYALRAHNTAGTAVETATVSVVLGLQFRT